MSTPVVAIVGRPNVGKSTLFNRIARERIAIVEDTPGVTRDRIYARCEWLNKEFMLVDTGGIDVGTDDEIWTSTRKQAEIAIAEADAIVFMVDGREGLQGGDRDVASILRRSATPVILCVNKVEPGKEDALYEFYELALDEPLSISAAHGLGIGDLLDRVLDSIPKVEVPEYDEDVIRVAVIGRPNVGKSSLVNALLGEDRAIVSPVSGTTRDALDTPLENELGKFVIIDTAGIRRKSRIEESVEYYSVLRAMRAVERADICLVVIDAVDGVTEQDQRIAGISHEEGRGCVIVVNKWDLITKTEKTMKEFESDIREQLSFLSYAPLVFVSALTRKRLPKILETAVAAANQRAMRIPTGTLNEVVSEATSLNEPPSDKGRRLKILYVTQAQVKPPVFLFFVNEPKLMHFSYERYLHNKIRDAFGFEGTPIKLVFRKRE